MASLEKKGLSISSAPDDPTNNLVARTAPLAVLPTDTFPSCSDDPAKEIPYKGSYKIGQGVQVPKKDPKGNDACDTKESGVNLPSGTNLYRPLNIQT